jgi:hypothetical protein
MVAKLDMVHAAVKIVVRKRTKGCGSNFIVAAFLFCAVWGKRKSKGNNLPKL